MTYNTTPRKLTGKKEELDEFIDKFDTFLFDCDGVLWKGNSIFPKVKETLEMLRSKGKRLVFVTNNSTKSRRAYKEKFASMGIPVTEEEIFGSAYSSAVYLSRVLKIPSDKKVFVLGESGIEEELRNENINYFGGTDPSLRPSELDTSSNPPSLQGYKVGPDPQVAAVLCGLDFHINYLKLSLAFGYLQDPNCHFFATNTDSTFPMDQCLLPGAGSVTSAPLSNMVGRKPVSFGKPSQAMMDSIEGKFKLDRAKTCMVGDRLDTDIMFGKQGGLGGTLAVLTGVSSEKLILEAGEDSRPDVYLDCLGDLMG